MIMTKKQGASSIPDMAAAVITVALCGIMVIYFAEQARYLDTCNAVNNAARRYILLMESSRGLTNKDEENLKNELAAYGVTNISLEGTTFYNPDLRPGDDIAFCLNCVYQGRKEAFSGFADINIPGVDRNICVERFSVVLR